MTTIKDAAKTLLSVCDGAITKDERGFNKFDAVFVRDVLSKDYFTYAQEQVIHELLSKYKVQLLNSFNIKYDELKFETSQPAPITTPQPISNGAEQIEVRFGKYKGYTLAEIAEEDMGYVRWMAENLDAGLIRDSARKLIRGEPIIIEKEKLKLSLKGNKILIKSPFEYKDSIKEIAERKWNPDLKVWEVPLTMLRDVVHRFPEAELSAELKAELDKAKTISELSCKAADENINIKFGEGLELMPFQSVGVRFVEKAGGKALIADEMGCLDGNTLISLNRNGKGFRAKLSNLYLRFNDLDNHKRHKWNLNEPTYARSLMSDGTIKLNQILNVIDKGMKETIKISTATKELILTSDHEILTPNGFIAAEKLKVGDKILTNGIIVCPKCGSDENIITYKYAKFVGYCKECMYRQLRENHLNYIRQTYDDGSKYITGGLQYHPYNTTGGIPEHRLIYEAYINNLTLDEYLEKLFINDVKDIKFLTSSEDIHHINGDASDNRIENLQLVTRSNHHIIHNKYANFGGICIPKEDIITNIEDSGMRNVYDIVMDKPARNFVANGIIVHNCGKTIQALAYLRLHPEIRPALIVCPASLKINWKIESQKWLESSEKISIINGDIEPGQTIYIINYDILMKHESELLKIELKAIVLDESHYVKSKKTKRSRSAMKISQNIPSRILLTGTPVLNRPKELFTQLNIVDPVNYSNFMNFAFRYCDATKGAYGYDFNGASNIQELNDRLKTTMVRRTKEQVLKELPDKRHQTIVLPLSNRTEYNEAHGDFIKYLRETIGSDAAVKASNAEHLTRIEGLKQLSAAGKMFSVIEQINNFLESGKKLVVFAHHKVVIEQLMNEFKDVAVSLTGETSMENRQKSVDDFQNNPKVKLFVGNIQAAGIGITLTASSDVMFIELPWTPSQLAQAEDRCHRIGQKNAVNVMYLVGESTIDIDIAELLEKKAKIINAVIDGKEMANLNILEDIINKYK